MSGQAVLVQHRTKAGAREEVERIWRKHILPAIRDGDAHDFYAYTFGSDPDRICAFQVYASADAAQAFVRSAAYARYEAEVSRFLDGPPQVEFLKSRWVKG